MRLFIALFLAAVPLLSLSVGFFDGENLITPYELDDDKWEILKKEEGHFKSMMWRSKDMGMADAYVVNIYLGVKQKPTKVRETQDAPGKKSCEMFESIELDPIPNQNYKSLLWRTVCTNKPEFIAQILHLAIQGKDSTYHLQKIWRGKISDSELEEWVAIFRKVYVCDTREDNKQCPPGYEKVRDV